MFGRNPLPSGSRAFSAFGKVVWGAVVAAALALADDSPAETTRFRPVDLRNPVLMPYRSQDFIDENGVHRQSQICSAMASANLVSQAVGVRVSPEELWFRSLLRQGLAWKELTGHELAVDRAFRDGSGFVRDTIEGSNREGYCRSANLERKLGTNPRSDLSALYRLAFSRRLSLLELTDQLRNQCGRRIHLPAAEVETVTATPSRTDALERVLDSLLDEGRIAAAAVNGHYVTVVGRTAAGDFLILNSQSASGLPVAERRPPLGDGTQIWPREAMAKWTERIEYLKKGVNRMGAPDGA